MHGCMDAYRILTVSGSLLLASVWSEHVEHGSMEVAVIL